MYIGDKYHIECMEKDLVYIGELMLRWPYLCYLKICDEVINRKLPLYISTESHIDIHGEPINIIMELDISHFQFDMIKNMFKSIVFLTKDVLKIEKKKKYRCIPAKSLTERKYSFCTEKNIHKIAPQLLYAMCSNAQKKFEVNAITHDMNTSTFDPMGTRMSGAKSDLEFTDKQIKGRSTTRRSTFKEKDNEWMIKAKTFIQCKREQGVTDKNDLATLVDESFPYHFTDYQLGILLPTKEGRDIKPESIRKQGQRLRKVE